VGVSSSIEIKLSVSSREWRCPRCKLCEYI
jgi:hypothetical protein